jgi:hypothetical protein
MLSLDRQILRQHHSLLLRTAQAGILRGPAPGMASHAAIHSGQNGFDESIATCTTEPTLIE